ncbi:hybrid sensor histidine kinase/response regulator [Thiohalobacter sp. IOR34]|uniref:hybrid sensor histidine kinase/response regulator n=1 Tax=Thiohalobacter sp. IOR34 TaxID=3057176 RepID=UPI0025B0ABF0|nr:hybrid sensor histidine kinase/response regulator [Thiohalobacter sp. IOR34]WJW74748.1 hybrid sensor histidine kinase/response regulator [Thiohalobacter sp. IOR34]
MNDTQRPHADLSMLALFRQEVEAQARLLSDGLLQLEQTPTDSGCLEGLMRAAHSLKGAARMVGVDTASRVAHAMEDTFVAAQQGSLQLGPAQIDRLLQALDLLQAIASHAEDPAWIERQDQQIEQCIHDLGQLDSATTETTAAGETNAAAEAPAVPAAIDPIPLALYQSEASRHLATLAEGLPALAEDGDTRRLDSLLEACNALQSAAGLVGLEGVERLTTAMQQRLQQARQADSRDEDGLEALLAAHSLLAGLDPATDTAAITGGGAIEALCRRLGGQREEMAATQVSQADTPPPAAPSATADPAPGAPPTEADNADNAVRISAENLNRLMGLAGEVQVESRWLRPHADALLQLKYRQSELVGLLDRLREQLDEAGTGNDYLYSTLQDAQRKADQGRQLLSERLGELEDFERRSHNLAERLNREVIASRMRPFADGVHGFRRMVRDLARELGKQVEFEIQGLATRVDRDILERLEAPLTHLLRNALDHGIETPEEREAAGKPPRARLRLQAMHSAGMLSILVEDDGRGMDLEALRRKVVERGLLEAGLADALSEAELMEFIFLPGFTTRNTVTDLSGRGVGLDVVHSVVQEMRGVVHAHSQPGQGMRFHLQLPLTLSVMRTLLVEIGGEPYAIPLAQIHHTLKLAADKVEHIEGYPGFLLGDQHIGLIEAGQVLELPAAEREEDTLCVVVLGEHRKRYGFVVDAFRGEASLVVRPLDPRLGKLQDISAAALLENGDPCLIIDVDDLLRSAEVQIAGGRLSSLQAAGKGQHRTDGKRILVVDDSITVREVERNMLANRGYWVDVAVDGMDGWNAVRSGDYQLVISDIDMPRMNGFELVSHIKNDPNLKSLPVMIVSYKDREEDRQRGLEVGADYYLTKGSFHDETLLEAVADLIGEA